MLNPRGVGRKYSTSVIPERAGRFTDKTNFGALSSKTEPLYTGRLGKTIDPTLQQRLINFDKTTEELFINFARKQQEELNSFNRQWIFQNGEELEATSHYLDIRNVGAREEIQRQNEYLIKSRNRALSSFRQKQKQQLQEFYNQRVQERNEIIETNDSESLDTVMSIVRNRSGVQVFSRTKNFPNSQTSTGKTKQITVNLKKKNNKTSFFFSRTKFEDKDITIGRFKAKKKPKKEEEPNLLDIEGLTRLLNSKDTRLQRIKREKEMEKSCQINEFGELNFLSGMSSAYISAAGSDTEDNISIQSGKTNGSANIATSVYDLHVERFIREEEKTNKEIGEFIAKQDMLMKLQGSNETDENLNNNTSSSQKEVKNEIYNDDYDNPRENDENMNEAPKKINDENQNHLSELIGSLKKIVDTDVNIFTKELSSTSENEEEEEHLVNIRSPISNLNKNKVEIKNKRTRTMSDAVNTLAIELKSQDKIDAQNRKILVHKHKSTPDMDKKEIKERTRSRTFNSSQRESNRQQEKQQFAFRTTLEMGFNSISAVPLNLEQNANED